MLYMLLFFFSFCNNLFCAALERQNHARELIREISLHEWDGIIIVSGDGLLHEVLFTCVILDLVHSEVNALLRLLSVIN